MTGGRGVSVAYDAVGKTTFFKSLDALSIRGHLVNYGAASGPVDPFMVSALAGKSNTVSRPMVFHFTEHADELRQMANAVFDAVANHTLRPAIGLRFPLREAGEAHRRLEARETIGSTLSDPIGNLSTTGPSAASQTCVEIKELLLRVLLTLLFWLSAILAAPCPRGRLRPVEHRCWHTARRHTLARSELSDQRRKRELPVRVYFPATAASTAAIPSSIIPSATLPAATLPTATLPTAAMPSANTAAPGAVAPAAPERASRAVDVYGKRRRLRRGHPIGGASTRGVVFAWSGRQPRGQRVFGQDIGRRAATWRCSCNTRAATKMFGKSCRGRTPACFEEGGHLANLC